MGMTDKRRLFRTARDFGVHPEELEYTLQHLADFMADRPDTTREELGELASERFELALAGEVADYVYLNL